MSINPIKQKKGKYAIYTVVTFLLLSLLFLSLVTYLYSDAEDRAMETLHEQTKQIKDDLTLQMLSDRENLATMANFAAKLYLDGEDYSLLFDSFKEIGLISNIGILTKDDVFITRNGAADIKGQITFKTEAEKGAYFSGRVHDLTNFDYERVRSAVPIVANGETVGILYGVIRFENFEGRYFNIANELDAQLFVYDARTGGLIVDSVHRDMGDISNPTNISFLRERKFNDGYSYEQFATTEKGFSSFRSAYRDEDVLLHYSTIEELGWKIALVRYDSQVYAETHRLMNALFTVFAMMVAVMAFLTLALATSEHRKNVVIDCASTVRKILIEASGNNNNNIVEALKEVVSFAKARSAIFFDADDNDYYFISPKFANAVLPEEHKKTLETELFLYISRLTAQEKSTFSVISLRVNKKLEKSNPSFYNMLKEHDIHEIVFSATVNNSNNITILSVLNPRRRSDASYLAEKVCACFAIAMDNHSILNKTRLAATTDALTGTLNRVAYNSDLHIINHEKPLDFSCIYIDVNELHYRNNKFGHAAGDEMLVYIAYTLKDVFFGQKVYRMGGDEFLVFCQNKNQEDVKKCIDIFLEQLKVHGYNVAYGISFRSQNTNTEEMVKEAEVRMYEDKAKYYQNKEQQVRPAEEDFVQVKTGILEIDTMLSIMKESYNGIYMVSLDTDRARRLLMPAYLNYNETEDNFSSLFTSYVSEFAEPDYHRSLLSFKNYDALKRQLAEGKTPRVTYKKLSGETVTLSVRKLSPNDDVSESLWIFSKK